MNYHTVAFEASYGTPEQLPPADRPEICFSGRSNVGKSSLLNKLLGRKALARVSAKPGKTVAINFFRLEHIRLCDLPGYGYAKVARAEKLRWAGLMEHYFQSGRDIRLVVQLVDMRHPPTEDDLSMLHFLLESGFPVCVALTKSDKLNKGQRAAREAALREELAFLPATVPVIPFSAVNGEGVEALRAAVEAAAGGQENGKETGENP